MDTSSFLTSKVVLDFFLVFLMIYSILKATQGTRTLQTFVMLLFVMMAFLLAQERFLDLTTFRWILDKFWSVIFLVIVVIYQDDLRRSLSRFRWFDRITRRQAGGLDQSVEEVVKAVRSLSGKRVGALICIEQTASLAPYVTENAIRIQADVTKELLFALFLTEHANPTHDGAVVIAKNHVVAAGVILPLTLRDDLDPALGTRHRAAIGLSEQVDALAVVVSEETSRVSVAWKGELYVDLSPEELRRVLQGNPALAGLAAKVTAAHPHADGRD